MTKKNYTVKGIVKIFDVENPWIYISVSKQITQETAKYADRGLVAITATTGNSSWKTSLMPMGDGTHFIPLPAKIRKAEEINVGKRITLKFNLRKR